MLYLWNYFKCSLFGECWLPLRTRLIIIAILGMQYGVAPGLITVNHIFRPKKQQSTTAGTTLAGLTTSAIYSISRDDDYEHVASSGGETGTTDYENLKSREERQLPDYVNLESRAESQLPSSTHGQQQWQGWIRDHCWDTPFINMVQLVLRHGYIITSIV